MRPETIAVHAATPAPPANRPAVLPIYEAAAWSFEGLDQLDAVYAGTLPGVIYGSHGGVNDAALELLVAALHGAEDALAANGGMTAISALLRTRLSPGARVVASRDVFGKTTAVLRELSGWGVGVEFVDVTDLAAVQAALAAGPALLFTETVSNPRLRVADLPALAELAHGAGAVLAVDNTFATPVLCRPLAHGADVVAESLTKFIGGHFDVLAGALAGPAALLAPVRERAVNEGLLPRPFESWLAVRGAETLALRVRQASATAATLAAWLDRQPAVRAVHYPGLADHPDHAVAGRVLDGGFGAMVAFEVDGGRREVNALLRALRLIRLVPSLGGVRTTLSHPATTSHRALAPAEREALGLHDGFLRLSVGIEAADDLLADLDRGLTALT